MLPLGPTDTPEEREEGLTRNCVDSIRHAVEHFIANHRDEYGFHNQKWAILSVAHAAEAFCNLVLLKLDQGHPHGKKYPDLERAISLLRGKHGAQLTGAERHAFKKAFPGLEDQRDALMHRPAPESLDMEQAALVLLTLMYLVQRRTGIGVSGYFDSPETAIFDELGLSGKDGRFDTGGMNRWATIAELLAQEDYGDQSLEGCETCGHFTMTPDVGCLACFAVK